MGSLYEGGVAGHMSHLYDNPELTFQKIKEILRAASQGNLVGTEKTDGQNLFLFSKGELFLSSLFVFLFLFFFID